MNSSPVFSIAPLQKLFSHLRFLLTLRSQEGKYHSLILFRLSPATSHPCLDDETTKGRNKEEELTSRGDLDPKARAALHQLYAMESACPHLGAEMTHVDIEEYEDTVVAVCPWHRYDFDLKTGKSETGLSACTYPVEVREEDDIEKVYIRGPSDGAAWRVVELRPVSEEFADPPPQSKNNEQSQNAPTEITKEDEPVVPLIDPPKTLMEWAVLILNTPNPMLKVERTKHAVYAFRTGKLTSIGHKSSKAPHPPAVPPREEGFKIVDPGKVKQRRNRAVMLHALANIEQWAIDLAWDIMARFGPMHKDLPAAFFSDFTKMALDESKHFSLLVSRLSALNTPYGSLPTHASLWESATATSDSFRSRLAIIHLVHEARGLDVNPATIEKFRKAGDKESVSAMEIIHADEVTHVTAGHRWFCWACEKGYGGDGSDPVRAFRDEVKRSWRGEIKGPFNVEDREKAGLSPEFYEDLRGDEYEPQERQEAQVGVGYDAK
ncbi:hypothetical protein PQX77_003993 [Marasmius sp. AFHP31]|nr:hypothetical protein PQX77_003993 [Marasmius sp. AFHP31]